MNEYFMHDLNVRFNIRINVRIYDGIYFITNEKNMFNTLMNNLNCKKFDTYSNSINNLYNLYYEMLDEKVKDINVYDKAKELDGYYEDVNDKVPDSFNKVKCLIINDYKQFNPEYSKNNKGRKKFTKEFVADELLMENCKLISDYVNVSIPIEYVYDNVKYRVTFKRWRNDGYRPHIYLFICLSIVQT